jgi:hypothetical protein
LCYINFSGLEANVYEDVGIIERIIELVSPSGQSCCIIGSEIDGIGKRRLI